MVESTDSALANALTEKAIHRLLDVMSKDAPHTAAQARQWMNTLAKTGYAADYFRHPLAFPMLLLPMWVEETLVSDPDLGVNQELQSDLIYSSVNGYYFIRIIDNVMDERSEVEIKLLPVCGFFHEQATCTYHRYFPAEHAFWGHFSRWNVLSAERAIEDGASTAIDLETFRRVAGQKVVAGKIPIAAVLGVYGKLQLLPQWEAFYNLLSSWHQMFNDVVSWQADMRHQNNSYFLSEGQRRKAESESLFGWLIREGFAWGLELLRGWLHDLVALAEALGSNRLLRYLDHRAELLESQARALQHTAGPMAKLLRLDASFTAC